jgi:hypothetical protein
VRFFVAEYQIAKRSEPIIASTPIPIPNVVGQSVPELGSAACGVAVGPLAINIGVAVAPGAAVAVGAVVAQEQVVSAGQDGLLQYPL